MNTKLVIFGITGDLSHRKLLPALRHIVQSGECEPLSIIGVSRREVDVPQLIHEATGDDTLVDRTSIYTMDLATPGDYEGLKHYVDLKDDEQLVIYLSVPPAAAADIVDFLGQAGLNGSNVKIMFEKPFGFDTVSAEEFVDRTGRYFTEDQIYRIDHYMAKEVALELLRLRSDAENHQHAWDNATVEHVEIIASEKIGVEDRAVFYEQAGALRDIIQGHLMQLLSLVLMEAASPINLDELPTRRFKALEQLKPVNPAFTIRAQYDGYGADVQNEGSRVETYVDMTIESADPRWERVPLRLITGKALAEKKTAITITYKDGIKDVFEEGAIPLAEGERLPDAYERVLVEAIRGRKYIFTTSPEIIRSWQVLAPVQHAWGLEEQPLLHYKRGAQVGEIYE